MNGKAGNIWYKFRTKHARGLKILLILLLVGILVCLLPFPTRMNLEQNCYTAATSGQLTAEDLKEEDVTLTVSGWHLHYLIRTDKFWGTIKLSDQDYDVSNYKAHYNSNLKHVFDPGLEIRFNESDDEISCVFSEGFQEDGWYCYDDDGDITLSHLDKVFFNKDASIFIINHAEYDNDTETLYIASDSEEDALLDFQSLTEEYVFN